MTDSDNLNYKLVKLNFMTRRGTYGKKDYIFSIKLNQLNKISLNRKILLINSMNKKQYAKITEIFNCNKEDWEKRVILKIANKTPHKKFNHNKITNKTNNINKKSPKIKLNRKFIIKKNDKN